MTDANGPNIATNIRSWYTDWGAPQAFLTLASGITMDYGFQGTTVPISSIVGPLVTFSSPHGVYNIVPGVSRITISGSSNSYFNGNFLIDACPTATSCLISRVSPSASGIPDTPNAGTITYADGTTSATVTMCADGGGACGSLQYAFQRGGLTCPGTGVSATKRGLTFTWAGSGANSYYTSNTFMFNNYVYPVSVANCGWREVPPSSQTSGSASGVVIPDNNYVRGRNYNLGEAQTGPRYPFGYAALAAVLGSSGLRFYLLGADQNYVYQGDPIFGSTSNQLVQAGPSPTYNQGEAVPTRHFWSLAAVNYYRALRKNRLPLQPALRLPRCRWHN